MMKSTGKFICYFMNSDTEKKFDTFSAACMAAEDYVGNRAYAKPFPTEERRLYGPGDGTTSVQVYEEFTFSTTVE